MARADGKRELKIGGRSFTLRFSILELATLEELWGCKGIQEIMARASNPGANDLVDIFYAVTRSHHGEDENLTRRDCLILLDSEGLGGITESLLGAIADSADDAAGEEAEGSGKPKPAT